MNPIIFWSNFAALAAASAIDVRSRRIPNWLVVPFLVAGLIHQAVTNGWSGAGSGLLGVGLATLLFGFPCLARGMGMGDLKLAAGVGAWVGPNQFLLVFVLSGITGALMAGAYALIHGSLGKSLDSAGNVVAHLCKAGFRPHPSVSIDNPSAASIPYAPAIAIGTLLSFAAR